MTNEQAILAYLKKRRMATKKDLLRVCGVYESGEYISRLRKKDHMILTNWTYGLNRNGRLIRFGEYVYLGKRK